MPISPVLRAQQYAARASFFMPGFAIAAWAPLVPFAKQRAGLNEASLGLLLLCLGTGALISMPVAGALAARLGCRRVLVVSTLLFCATLPLLAWTQAPWLLGALLFVFGAGIGAMDCAINMQAVVIERESEKSMMSGFHAFYSIGGFAGAAGMTLLLSVGLAPVPSGALIVAAVLVLLAVSASYWRSDRTGQDTPSFAWPKGMVVLIGAMCFITFLAEGAMLDWSAVFLHEVHGVEPQRAGAGFVVFSLMVTVGRLLGDRLIQKAGRTRIVALGSICAAAGTLIATLVPFWEVALLGYALIGVGCANIAPAMFSLAGQQKVMPESLAIPAITTLGYAGVLAGPALIGFFAHATSLVIAFLGLAVALLGVAVSTRWLKA